MTERWRRVRGWPSYEVSDLGRVRSLKGVMTPWTHDCGDRENTYLRVTLKDHGRRTNARIHVLVARAFVSGYRKGRTVDHVNEDTHDNRAENLRWETRLRNVRLSRERRRG